MNNAHFVTSSFSSFLEAATLIQTGKLPCFPIVMMGRDYWNPIRAAMREVMFHEGTFKEGEVDMFITDSPVDAVAQINQAVRPELSSRP